VTPRENILRGIGPAAKNSVKTHCPQGHEYAGENLIITNRGDRYCRTCAKISDRKRKDKMKKERAHELIGT
jgi:hypothetical protein